MIIPGLSTIKTWLLGLFGIAVAVLAFIVRSQQVKALKLTVKEAHKAAKANVAATKAAKKQREQDKVKHDKILQDIDDGDDSFFTG